jgi:hypothetical protein
MLISFNATISNNKKQSTSFKSLNDGRIVTEEVAKHSGIMDLNAQLYRV